MTDATEHEDPGTTPGGESAATAGEDVTEDAPVSPAPEAAPDEVAPDAGAVAEPTLVADTAVADADSVAVETVETPVEDTAEIEAVEAEPVEPKEIAESAATDEPAAAAEPVEPEEAADAAEATTVVDGDTDDVTEAIAAAGENVEAESTLDDIAPGTVGTAEAATVVSAEDTKANKVSIWPFVVYDALWLIFAGLIIWQFEMLPPGTAIYEAELYPVAVLVGVVLLAAGPLLIFVAWIASWGRPGSSKGRLFMSALVRGSVATLIGVIIWWVALLVLDQIRLGALV